MEVTRDFKKDENNLLIKIVVIGDVNVGKTNIIRRIIGEDFKEMEATIGVEFMYLKIKNIDIENEFLKGNTDFSGSLNLSDLWFLNGSDNKFSIMFFREELYEAFKIRIFRTIVCKTFFT